MNDLCVILTAASMLGSGFYAGVAGAHEFSSEYFVFADPMVESGSGSDGLATRRLAIAAQTNDRKIENDGDIHGEWSTGRAIADNESGRKPFMWPWASSPTQDNSIKKKRQWHGNRDNDASGSRSGNSGSGNMGGSSTGNAGNMGSGSTNGSSNTGGTGNMGGGGSGNMK
ncbi:hypothetical protein [Rhizobium lusitanum]|uniref:hypothetical protein n=1 Tax=Rhizobium lusitanum TaxID=293958 RepID=UPI0019576D13|nr:hypothetical protein [Rhizobium lusitanum]MBM7043904.1 hypothetical protein [Rhizobium lusitanum]